MQADDIRWLFAYDRWATRRVLNVLDDLDPAVWARTHVVDERGLGGILVHHLGAAQRWRIGLQTVDHRASDEFRVVQLTPPGSGCSITFGIGVAQSEPEATRGCTWW